MEAALSDLTVIVVSYWHYLIEVDKGMDEPSGSERPEAKESRRGAGVGQEVEGADEEVGQNVLEVILVGTPHPLNPVLVEADLALGPRGGILGVSKDLKEKVKWEIFNMELIRCLPGWQSAASR